MQGPISVRRVAGALMTLLLGAATVWLITEAVRMNKRLAGLQAARPISVPVDLSQAGVTEVLVTAGPPTLHGLSYHLQIDGEPRDLAAALDGLVGKLEFIGPDARVVAEADLPADGLYRDPQSATTTNLTHSRSLLPGPLTLRLTVEEPALALVGVRQTLFARNEFCAAETIPPALSKWIAGFAAVATLLFGGFTALGLWHHGWRDPPRGRGIPLYPSAPAPDPWPPPGSLETERPQRLGQQQ